MPGTHCYTEFLPVNPDTADQDLRDVLAHGLIGAPNKAELSELLRTGKSNREVALWLSRAYPDIIETMELETGDTADYVRLTWNKDSRYCVDGILCRTPEELFDLLLTDYQDCELLRRTKGRREVTEADEKAVEELCQPYLDWRKEALK